MALTDGAIVVLVEAERQTDEALKVFIGELADEDCDVRTATAIQCAARRICERAHRLELEALDKVDQIAARKQLVREAIDIFTDGRF